MRYRILQGLLRESDLEPYIESKEVTKIKPIKSKVRVYLAIKEEDEEFRSLLDKNGFKWYSGDSLIDLSLWKSDIEATKIHFVNPDKTITYEGDKTPDTLTFSEFKKQYFEPYTEPTTNDNMEEKEHRNLLQETANCDKEEDKELNLKEIMDSDFYCGYKECCRNGEGNLPPLKCDKVLCVARVMKPKRWRAKDGDEYWYFDSTYTPQRTTDEYILEDELRYESGNYFKTPELCQQAAEAVRECLMKFHEQQDQQ